MLAEFVYSEDDEEAGTGSVGLVGLRIKDTTFGFNLSTLHLRDGRFHVEHFVEGELLAEFDVELGSDDGVVVDPAGKAHGFVEYGGHTAAVGVAGRAFSADTEPDLGAEGVVCFAVIIVNAEAVVFEIAGDKGAAFAEFTGEVEMVPAGFGGEFRGEWSIQGKTILLGNKKGRPQSPL